MEEKKLKIDWRGYVLLTPKESNTPVAPSSLDTHRHFQRSAGIRADGYKFQSLPVWSMANWRYNPETGGEIRLEDGHGNRMHGN